MIFGDRVFKEMYDIMAEVERELNAMHREYTQDYRIPLIDIYDTENELVIIIELPGVKKEDITLNVLPTVVEISAELMKKTGNQVKKYYKKERIIRRYYRSITLPIKVSTEEVKAKYENGVLVIRFKKEASQKKRIEIQ